jgi:hypothetical protein
LSILAFDSQAEIKVLIVVTEHFIEAAQTEKERPLDHHQRRARHLHGPRRPKGWVMNGEISTRVEVVVASPSDAKVEYAVGSVIHELGG